MQNYYTIGLIAANCCVVNFLNEMINVNLQITKLNNHQTSSRSLNYLILSPAHLHLAKCSSPIWFSNFSPHRFFQHLEGTIVIFCPFWSWASFLPKKGAPAQKNVDFGHPVSKTVKSGRVEPKCSKPAQLVPNAFRVTQRVEVEFMPSFELLTHQVSERVSMRWTLTFLVQLQNL